MDGLGGRWMIETIINHATPRHQHLPEGAAVLEVGAELRGEALAELLGGGGHLALQDPLVLLLLRVGLVGVLGGWEGLRVPSPPLCTGDTHTAPTDNSVCMCVLCLFY